MLLTRDGGRRADDGRIGAGSYEQRGRDAHCGQGLSTRTSVCDICGLTPVAPSRRVELARGKRAASGTQCCIGRLLEDLWLFIVGPRNAASVETAAP